MGHLPKSSKRPWIPEPKPHEGRKKDFSQVYNSQRHRKQRKRYLAKNPFCVYCDRVGKLTPAVVFDHIIPLSEDSSNWATWSLENKQGLCHPCHNSKSGRESQAAQKRKKEDDNNS